MNTPDDVNGLDLDKLEETAADQRQRFMNAVIPHHELAALIAAAKREELRNRREGTHAPDCHLWGPRHYDCLAREFAAANARIAELEATTLRKAAKITREWSGEDCGLALLFENMAKLPQPAPVETPALSIGQAG